MMPAIMFALPFLTTSMKESRLGPKNFNRTEPVRIAKNELGTCWRMVRVSGCRTDGISSIDISCNSFHIWSARQSLRAAKCNTRLLARGVPDPASNRPIEPVGARKATFFARQPLVNWYENSSMEVWTEACRALHLPCRRHAEYIDGTC